MSSTPIKEGSVAGDDPMSTPPSSPPSAEGDGDRDYDPRHERMEAEEKRLRQQAKQEEAEERKRSLDWVKAGQGEQKGQFSKLMHLVNQGKVFATLMQKRMQQEEEKSAQKSEAERKKLERQQSQREEAAASSQRRTTRNAAKEDPDEVQLVQNSPSKSMPVRGRGRPKKNATKNGSIASWLKKDEVDKKAGGMTVAEAVAEAATDEGVQATGLGAQNLRPDNQPEAVTGGIMRGYQLEGLYWLRSLYENGLNGILADEMGLGKTIQTISFLAFLREMKSFGPFLVVAPLSTLSNWIDEFAKWTPDINTLLYHGSPDDRAKLRSSRLRRPGTEAFPVVCTSYEICMNDRKFLSQYGWKFIIIDEGHRLKNLNCRLIKELKQYQSANRLLITGTPLQNNLAELWSLLNFLMPEVFDTLENFESFFDFSAVLDKGGHKEIIEDEQKNSLVASLHAILKPFLLRRVKTDVETELPKKREYILYAPLAAPQKELYKQILEGNSRAYLEQQAVDRMLENSSLKAKSSASSLKRKLGSGSSTPNKSSRTSRDSTPNSTRSGRRRATRLSYAEVSDRQYFHDLAQPSSSEASSEEDAYEAQLAKTIKLAKKEIANKKLQNPIMQLRLACDSPHNFFWPWTESQTPDASLVSSSGKMRLLDQLVPHLISRGHKVLIFSQFQTQLDIIETWATAQRGYRMCRIDGSVPHTERQSQIKAFNTSPKVPLFLLSTRAGGQGINLTAADTVILFDSDWNPQQDLQAQDRAHRIGQTRPVLVYRLATRGTVEQTLLDRADGKRRLEKLVIRRGKFKSLSQAPDEDWAELARLLECGDGQDVDADGGLLGEEDLEVLTDRSDEAYERAERGEGRRGAMFRAVETRRDTGVLAEVSGQS